MALPARLNIHRGTWTSANATSSDTGVQYALGNMVVHDTITYLYINTLAGDQDNPVTAGPSVWLPLGVDTHGATFITAASDAVVIDTGGVLSYDLDPATTGANDFVNFIRIGPQISVAFADRPTVASHTGWVYLEDNTAAIPALSDAIALGTTNPIVFTAREYTAVVTTVGSVALVFNISTTNKTLTFTADENTDALRSARIRRFVGADSDLILSSSNAVDPDDGLIVTNGLVGVDHSVVATHFNAQRTYVAGNSVFFDIGPTTSGRRIRSYWTTNAPITAGQVPVFTLDTVGAGTYEQNDYIVDTVGGNRGLYLRTSPTGTANRPSDVITGWTLQSPTSGNWRELALDLNADSIGDLGDVDTTTTAPTNGQVLKWNATDSEWQPADDNAGGGGGSTTLAGLSDVTAPVAADITANNVLAVTGGTAAAPTYSWVDNDIENHADFTKIILFTDGAAPFLQLADTYPDHVQTYDINDHVRLRVNINGTQEFRSYLIHTESNFAFFGSQYTGSDGTAGTIRYTNLNGNTVGANAGPFAALSPTDPDVFANVERVLEIIGNRVDDLHLVKTDTQPTEAPFFASTDRSDWELEGRDFNRGNDEVAQIIQHPTPTSTVAVGTASTNLGDLNASFGAGPNNLPQVPSLQLGAVRSGDTLTLTYSILNNPVATTAGQTTVLQLARDTIGRLTTDLTAATPFVFRTLLSNSNTIQYFVVDARVNAAGQTLAEWVQAADANTASNFADTFDATTGTPASFSAGLAFRITNTFNEHARVLTGTDAAISDDDVPDVRLFRLHPTGGEIVGSGLVRDTNGTVRVNPDGTSLDVRGTQLEIADQGVTSIKLHDRAVTHSKVADNAISNRNLLDQSVSAEKIRSRTIGSGQLSLSLLSRIDDPHGAVLARTTSGEIPAADGTILIPTPSVPATLDDWTMIVRPNGSRYIEFTENYNSTENPPAAVGDHLSILVGGDTVTAPTGMVDVNAVIDVAPHNVLETTTFTANAVFDDISGPLAPGRLEFQVARINGVVPDAEHTFTFNVGDSIRVGSHTVIFNNAFTVNSDNFAVTLSGGGATQNASPPAANGQAIDPISRQVEVTRVQMELVEDSMVGSVALFTYLDALTPDQVIGGNGIIQMEALGEFYERTTTIHTIGADSFSLDLREFEEVNSEFIVTNIFTGGLNSRTPFPGFEPTALTDSAGAALTYENVAVSFTVAAEFGQFHLHWRGDQAEIDAIVDDLARRLASGRSAIYFNSDPTGNLIPTDPHIRVITNLMFYLDSSAGTNLPEGLGLSLDAGNDGTLHQVQLESSTETLGRTQVHTMASSRLDAVGTYIDDTDAVLSLRGVDTRFPFGAIPLDLEIGGNGFAADTNRFDDLDIHTLFYGSNTDATGVPRPAAQPHARTAINSVPYRTGTRVRFTFPTTGSAREIRAFFSGPDAQRAADDVLRTFTDNAPRTSSRALLFFSNLDSTFDERSLSFRHVGIPPNEDVLGGQHLIASEVQRAVPGHLVPTTPIRGVTGTIIDPLTGVGHPNTYTSTFIQWRRVGEHFEITLDGVDRIRAYNDIIRSFGADRFARAEQATLIIDTGSGFGVTNDDLRALPYISANAPPIASFDNNDSGLRASDLQVPVIAPSSSFNQAGDNQLRAYELQTDTVVTLDIPNSLTGNPGDTDRQPRQVLIDFGSSDTATVSLGAGGGVGNVVAGPVIPGTNVGSNNNTTTVPNGGMFYKTLTSPATTWRMNNGAQPAVFTANLLGSDAGLTTGTSATAVLTLAFLLGSVQSLITGAPTASLTNPTGAIFVDNTYTDAAGGRARGRLDAEGLFDLLNVVRPADPDTGMHDPLGLTDRDGNRVRLRTVGGTAGVTAGGDGLLVTGIGRRNAGVGGNSDHGLIQFSNPTGTTAVFAVPPAVGTEVQRQLTPAVGTGTAVDQVLNGAGGYVFDSTTGDNGSWTAVPAVNPSVT